MSQDKAKLARREKILSVVVGVPIVAFVLAYELFGWVPSIPTGVRQVGSFAFQFAFALVVSAVIAGWCYLFCSWISSLRIRLAVSISIGLVIGVSAVFNPSPAEDPPAACRPSGPGIYNDC